MVLFLHSLNFFLETGNMDSLGKDCVLGGFVSRSGTSLRQAKKDLELMHAWDL